MQGKRVKNVAVDLTDVPLDVLYNEIIEYLLPKDIFNLSSTDQYFCKALYNDGGEVTYNAKFVWLNRIIKHLDLYLPVLFKLAGYDEKLRVENGSISWYHNNTRYKEHLRHINFFEKHKGLGEILVRIDEIGKAFAGSNFPGFPDEKTTFFDINNVINKNAIDLRKLLATWKIKKLTEFTFHLCELIRTISVDLTINNIDNSLFNLPKFKAINTLCLQVDDGTNEAQEKGITFLLEKIKFANLSLCFVSESEPPKNINLFRNIFAIIAKQRGLISFKLELSFYDDCFNDNDGRSLITNMKNLCERNENTLRKLKLYLLMTTIDDDGYRCLGWCDFHNILTQDKKTVRHLLKNIMCLKQLEELTLLFGCDNYCENILDILPPKLPPHIKYLYTDCYMSVKELQKLITEHIQNPGELIKIKCYMLRLTSHNDCHDFSNLINKHCSCLKEVEVTPDHDEIRDEHTQSLINYLILQNKNIIFDIGLSFANYHFCQYTLCCNPLWIKENKYLTLRFKFTSKLCCDKIYEEEELRKLFRKETSYSVGQACINLWNALICGKRKSVEDIGQQSAHRKVYIKMLLQLINFYKKKDDCEDELQLKELSENIIKSEEFKNVGSRLELALERFFDTKRTEMKPVFYKSLNFYS